MSEKIQSSGATTVLEPLVRFVRSEHFEEDVERLGVGEVVLRLDPSGESVELAPGGPASLAVTGTELWLPPTAGFLFEAEHEQEHLSIDLLGEGEGSILTGPMRIVVEYAFADDVDADGEPLRLAPGTLLGVLHLYSRTPAPAAATDVFPGE